MIKHLVIFSLTISLCSPLAYSVDPSDLPENSAADVLERRVIEEAEDALLRSKIPSEIEIESQKKSKDEPEALKVKIDRIVLTIDSSIPSEEAQKFIQTFEDKKYSFSELQEIPQKLEAFYRTLGYFVLAYLPPQKLGSGELQIKVLVSRMGELKVEGIKYSRMFRLKSYWDTEKGEVIRYDQVISDLIQMNENPDRSVRPIMVAGKTLGETDVILNVKESFPVHASYNWDNSGVNLTGKKTHGFTLRHNNFFGFDDTLLVGTSFGNRFGAIFVQYLLPLTSFGTELVTSFSHSQVNPKKEFEQFGINGISQSYRIMLRQDIVKSAKQTFEAFLGYDIKEKTTHVLSISTVWDRLRVLFGGFDYVRRDSKGAWVLKPEVRAGIPLHGDGFPLNSRGAETQFFIFKYDLLRQQKLPYDILGSARLRGQHSDSRLMSQEQMYFGGASTVRGYPESDFLGDQGILANFELQIPVYIIPKDFKLPGDQSNLRDRLHLLAFLDYGYGRVNDPSATDLHTRTLLGTGGGVEFRLQKYFSLRVEWGVPLADRPITESGSSQFHFRLKANI